ncbi:MAG: hypothetical protein IKC22_03400 [Bacilli bacterium]|nr:hypothetical protein [Bacilli bacterium]
MYTCKKCGKELNDELMFCTSCGTKKESTNKTEEVTPNRKTLYINLLIKKEKMYQIFSILSIVLGSISCVIGYFAVDIFYLTSDGDLIRTIMLLLSLSFSVPAFVLNVIATKTTRHLTKIKIGYIFSILGLILSITMMVLMIIDGLGTKFMR